MHQVHWQRFSGQVNNRQMGWQLTDFNDLVDNRRYGIEQRNVVAFVPLQ
jgi:hypothetical protein